LFCVLRILFSLEDLTIKEISDLFIFYLQEVFLEEDISV
jgi:hypothetical protein